MSSSLGFDVSSVRLAATRRHVTQVLALDISASMGCTYREGLVGRKKTRLEVACEGACRVLDALGSDDHVVVLAFGEDVEDVAGGIVQLTPANKEAVKRKIRQLRPNGRTKLYDTMLAGLKLILSIAAAAKMAELAGEQDLGTFWFLVLTDGDDTHSQTNLSAVVSVTREISSDLGPDVMNMALIGVNLGESPRSKMQQIARAGGSMTKFVDAKSIQEVTSAFDDIALQVQMIRMRVTTTVDDSSSTWPGEIQKGSHVRCVGFSRGATRGVDTGDVGVVQSRDSDGDYIVDFPRKDGWYGRPSDICLDHDAEKVRPGALVSVKASVTDPAFGWGPCTHGIHGLVVKVQHDGIVHVQFGFNPDSGPNDNLWKSQLKELEVVDSGTFQGMYRGTWPGQLQLGMAVRVPLSLQSPSTGWGSLKRGDVGYVRGYNPERQLYVCDFPSVDGWRGREGDLEPEAVATMIRPGKKVRVRQGVTPSGGWAGVTPSSVGTVVSSHYDGRCVQVKFPEHSTWKGKLTELETLDRPPTESLPYAPRVPTATPVKTTPSSSIPIVPAVVSPDQAGAPSFPDGSIVVLKGLNSSSGARFNGKMAKVITKVDDDYVVELMTDDKELKKLNASHLMVPWQKYENGKLVELRDIEREPGLNGTIGTICGFDSTKGRYTINASNRMLSLLPTNFEVIPDAEELS